MPFRFSQRSLDSLRGVHPDLVRVVHRALELTGVDFTVIEGLRSIERQRELVKSGASQTMNSRHLTGHAVDMVNIAGKVANWGRPQNKAIADAMLAAGAELGIPVEWGGNWKTFKDTPHFQLPWKHYPAEE